MAVRKCVIIFPVLGCGTDHEKSDGLDFSLRTLATASQGDSGERSKLVSTSSGGLNIRGLDIR